MLKKSMVTRCDDAWVFIFALGRSGSTTVLGMLNQVPFVNLSGENDNLYGDLLHLFDKTLGLRHREHDAAAWWNDPQADRLQEDVCDWMANLVRPGQIHGFKEIRYKDADKLIRLLPNAKYILNYRNDDQRAKERWFTQKANMTAEKHALFSKFRAARHVRYLPLESFSVNAFNDLLRWLGIQGCHFIDVLHYNDKGLSTDARNVLRDNCTLMRPTPPHHR